MLKFLSKVNANAITFIESYFQVLAFGFQFVADKRRDDADRDEEYRGSQGVYLEL